MGILAFFINSYDFERVFIYGYYLRLFWLSSF